MDLPTIEKTPVHIVRMGKEIRYAESESQAKDLAFDLAIREFVHRVAGFNGTPAEMRDPDGVTLGQLIENRHELHRICNLLNGGNPVPVSAPPRVEIQNDPA